MPDFGASLSTAALRRIAAVLCLSTSIATVVQSALAADAADDLDRTVAQLVADLDSPAFPSREAAARQLRGFGFAAIEPLTQAAEGGSLEVAVRAVEILEAIYQTAGEWLVEPVGEADESDAAAEPPFAAQVRKYGREPPSAVETANAAEAALERLKQSANRSVASRAAATLEGNYQVRERLALAAIRKLGGAVDSLGSAAPNVRVAPNVDEVGADYFVRLDDMWTGGDEGLQQIKRLNRLGTLYIIDGAKISEEAIQNLQAALPNLNVQFRGPAFLGISGQPNQFGGLGCLVDRVTPEAAADRAGIRRGDMIVRFGGKPVTDFVSLIDLIGTYKAGAKVEVELRRDGRIEKLEVVLDRWSGPSG